MQNTKRFIPVFLVLGGMLLTGCSKASSITLSLAPDQTPVINQPVIIDVQTKPVPIKINPNSISISGGDSWVEDGVIKFEAEEPGEYFISVNQKDTKSNELKINVARPDFLGQANSQNPSDSSKNEHSEKESEENSQSSSQSKDPASTVQEEKISVDQAYSDQNQLIDNHTPITVNGQLPQARIRDKAGNEVQVLWNDQTSEYIILDGFEIPFGGCPAQVSGTLSRNAAGELVLNMSYKYVLHLNRCNSSGWSGIQSGFLQYGNSKL